MSLMRRDPLEALMPLREAMNRLLEESFIGPRFDLFTGRTFPLDVYESPDKQRYMIEASLAGFRPDEIQITAEGDTVTIRSAKKEEAKAEKGTYIRHERYEGEISRSVTLPTTIDASKVQATYDHGIVILSIPKVAEAKPKQIPIQIKEITGAR